MEGGDKKEGDKLKCVICGTSKQNDFSNKEINKKHGSKSKGLENKHRHPKSVLVHFCKELELFCPSGESLSLGNNLSVCSKCADNMNTVLDTKERMELVEERVRELQLNIIQELKELQVYLDLMGLQLGKIERCVKQSEGQSFVSPGNIDRNFNSKDTGKGDKKAEEGGDVVIVRKCLMNVTKDMYAFRDELKKKTVAHQDSAAAKPNNKPTPMSVEINRTNSCVGDDGFLNIPGTGIPLDIVAEDEHIRSNETSKNTKNSDIEDGILGISNSTSGKQNTSEEPRLEFEEQVSSDTTDDEDFFSPQIFPYRNKLKTLTKSRSQEEKKKQKSPSPEKETPNTSISLLKNAPAVGFSMDETFFANEASPLRPTTNVPISEGSVSQTNEPTTNCNSFLEVSTITLDGTPSPPSRKPAVGATHKCQSKDKPVKRLANLFEISIKKKEREVWKDVDVQAAVRIAKKEQKKQTQYKQQSLISVARNMPRKKETADITSYKDFAGGLRTSSSSQSQLCNSQPTTMSGASSTSSKSKEVEPIKRKSDENIENSKSKKREKTESYNPIFAISPIKINPPSPKSKPGQMSPPIAPISPLAGPSRIIRSPNSSPLTSRESNNNKKQEQKLNCTLDFIKDFDKIPTKVTYEPNFRYKEPVVRKKAERAKLQGWDCEECRGYYELLGSQLDEKEIERIRNRCSRHRSKRKVVSNTPENFWCTPLLSTEELYREGYIREGTPFTPPPRRKIQLSSEDDSE